MHMHNMYIHMLSLGCLNMAQFLPTSAYQMGLLSDPLQRLAACARLGALSAEKVQSPGTHRFSLFDPFGTFGTTPVGAF